MLPKIPVTVEPTAHTPDAKVDGARGVVASPTLDLMPEAEQRRILSISRPQAVLTTFVVRENIHDRLGKDEFVTLTLLRYFRDGRVEFAGAHEDLILYRFHEVDAWMQAQDDDVTTLVIRYQAAPSPEPNPSP